MNVLNVIVCLFEKHEWAPYETTQLAGRICTRCGRVNATLIIPPELARRRACERAKKGTP